MKNETLHHLWVGFWLVLALWLMTGCATQPAVTIPDLTNLTDEQLTNLQNKVEMDEVLVRQPIQPPVNGWNTFGQPTEFSMAAQQASQNVYRSQCQAQQNRLWQIAVWKERIRQEWNRRK